MSGRVSRTAQRHAQSSQQVQGMKIDHHSNMATMGSSGNNDCRVYVGNLPPDIRSKDIEDIFHKYGKIEDIDLKIRRGYGPPFAFVEFQDRRDAADAVYGRDGYNYDGYRLRVEFPRGGRGGYSGGGGGGGSSGGGGGGGGGGGSGGGGGGGGSGGGGSGGSGDRRSRGAPPMRSDYRCFVTGLPPTGSWQDLKDHMREAGDVCYADVYRDGSGVVEFRREQDLKYAVRVLDDTKFKSHEGETSYIRVKLDEPHPRSRSRSLSPGYVRRRGSPRYSPARRSFTPSRSRSRSRSYSHSRSSSS